MILFMMLCFYKVIVFVCYVFGIPERIISSPRRRKNGGKVTSFFVINKFCGDYLDMGRFCGVPPHFQLKPTARRIPTDRLCKGAGLPEAVTSPLWWRNLPETSVS